MRPISGCDKDVSKVICTNFGDFLQKLTFKPLDNELPGLLYSLQNDPSVQRTWTGRNFHGPRLRVRHIERFELSILGM